MKHVALALAVITALTACDSTGGGDIRQQEHRTVAARGITTVRIVNVSGTVEVRPSKNSAAVIVDATKKAGSEDELARTHVDIESTDGVLKIETKYDRNGGFWLFNQSGGSVDYIVYVPATMALRVENVSGSIAISGVQGDVDATNVSGSIDATLGRMSGNRQVALNAVSGGISAAIARKSDVHITAHAISGSITQFADGDVHDTRLGSGSASLKLSTISGSISVTPLH